MVYHLAKDLESPHDGLTTVLPDHGTGNSKHMRKVFSCCFHLIPMFFLKHAWDRYKRRFRGLFF